jgi:hypothetical protein
VNKECALWTCLPAILVSIGSCASVDQFGARPYDGNVNNQTAINQEVLLNIIRASRYQSFSWNPVNQITGGQTETLATGLPTINIGPNQTAAERVYSISNNLTSSATGSYISSPLLSTNFQNGMLAAVNIQTINNLSVFYPREAVYFALISSIIVTDVKTKEVARLTNDPTLNGFNPKNPVDNADCQALVENGDDNLFPGIKCSYSKFAYFLKTLIRMGLFTEPVNYPASSGQPPGASSPGQTSGGSQSSVSPAFRFCVSPSLATFSEVATTPNWQHKIATEEQYRDFRCGGSSERRNVGGNAVVQRTTTSKDDEKTFTTKTVDNTQTTTTTTSMQIPAAKPKALIFNYGNRKIQLDFEFRSPSAYLSYLGLWYKYRYQVYFPGYLSSAASRVYEDGPYLAIEQGGTSGCYTSISYFGDSYCVPPSASHTAMLMDIAVVLRNLNIQPSDLNSAFTVRLTP